MSFAIKVELNRLPDLARALPSQVRLAIEETAAEVEAMAKEIVPVDLGYLKGSISHKMNSDTEGEVSVGADYGPHVEYGTVHQAAQPYLRPALEGAQEEFGRRLVEIVEGNLS